MTDDKRSPGRTGEQRRVGDAAMMLISADSVTVQDTQGIETFRLDMGRHGLVDGARECGDERERQVVIRWERMHCNSCGVRVWEGAIFCRECKPYGFCHWLMYFSPVAWRRCRIGNGRG